MLFDIRGKRKRIIQVIYVFLALLLGGSLVLFGIGGDANGGLGDAARHRRQQQQRRQHRVQRRGRRGRGEARRPNPENTAALLSLARYNYLNGQQSLEVDEDQGTQTLTDEAITDFEASIDAWERYLKANKGTAGRLGRDPRLPRLHDARLPVHQPGDDPAPPGGSPEGRRGGRRGTPRPDQLPGPGGARLPRRRHEDRRARPPKQALKSVDDAGPLARWRRSSSRPSGRASRSGSSSRLSRERADPDALENPLGEPRRPIAATGAGSTPAPAPGGGGRLAAPPAPRSVKLPPRGQ